MYTSTHPPQLIYFNPANRQLIKHSGVSAATDNTIVTVPATYYLLKCNANLYQE